MGKHPKASKTVQANTAAAVLTLVQMVTGFVVPPEYQALALIGINIGLRFVTKEPLKWKWWK